MSNQLKVIKNAKEKARKKKKRRRHQGKQDRREERNNSPIVMGANVTQVIEG